MRRILLAFVLGLVLMPLIVYRGPVCADIQRELSARVRAFISMHVLDGAPVVAVKQSCGVELMPDAMWFFYRNVAFHLGLQKARPFSWQDLRLKPTQVLLQHADLGTARWDVRLDSRVDEEKKKRVEDMLGRYLKIQGRTSSIDWKTPRSKAKEDVGFLSQPFTVATVIAQTRSQTKQENDRFWSAATLESWRQPLRVVISILLVLFSLVLVRPFWTMLRKRSQRPPPQAKTPLPLAGSEREGLALFTPYFIADWRERCSEMLSSWELATSAEEIDRQVKEFFSLDRDALSWSLVHAPAETRARLLKALLPEQVATLADFVQQQASAHQRTEIGALSRFLVYLARVLGQARKWPKAPLYVHCLTVEQWQALASQLSRSRRRAISARLNGKHAEALRLRNEEAFDWVQSSTSQESEEVILQKIRICLEERALGLRECLNSDREAVASLDGFFSQLSGDVALNAELALLLQAAADLKRRPFTSHAAAGDSRLALALQQLDPESAALALFDCDSLVQSRMLRELGAHREAVAASLQALVEDKAGVKKWRMRSKSLQRFLERQVLIAQIFAQSPSVL